MTIRPSITIGAHRRNICGICTRQASSKDLNCRFVVAAQRLLSLRRTRSLKRRLRRAILAAEYQKNTSAFWMIKSGQQAISKDHHRERYNRYKLREVHQPRNK